MNITHYNLYHYDPSMPLAYIALSVFALFTVIVSYQASRYKTRYMYAIACGSAGETVGFATRVWSGQPDNTGNIGAYAVSTLFLLLPPIAIALSSYLLVAKIITYLDFKSKYIRPILVEKAYLSIDVICFFIQSSGGGMMAITSMAEIGSKISLIGLIFAVISISTFAVLTFFVQRAPNSVFQIPYGCTTSTQWRVIYWPLWINIVALLIRSIYRSIEFAQGFDGYLITHEVYFYVFDSLMMFCAILAYILVPPGKYLQPGLASRSVEHSGKASKLTSFPTKSTLMEDP